jgi:hypothetical protein
MGQPDNGKQNRMTEQACQQRTVRTVWLVQDSQSKRARTGQLSRTARKGEQEQDRQKWDKNRSGRRWHVEKDYQRWNS